MKSFLLLVALFVCAALASQQASDSKQFLAWIKLWNKQYANHNEFQNRFANFQESLRRIEKLNSNAARTAQYGLTKFSDMSQDEFRSMPCGYKNLNEINYQRPGFSPVMGTIPVVAPEAVPTTFDWEAQGAVTGVKNQGQCGSCWAFSTIGNSEGVYFLHTKNLVGLSEEQVVDCSTQSGDEGCNGGWPFWAFTDMDASPYNGQFDTEAGYPYIAGNGVSGNCSFSTGDVGAKLTGYQSFCQTVNPTAPCGESGTQALLMKYGPLSACLDATPMQSYQGGVDNPGSSCDPTAIDHCITLVGWGVDNSTGAPFWRIKNSWGTDWGENGYYRLYRDNSNSGAGQCGITSVLTSATP